MNQFEIDAIVEIPRESMYKYEVDKKTGILLVDRPLSRPVPFNYGYVPGTLHNDGDPLDIFLIGNYPIYPLAQVKAKILGALICNDNGSSDDKLIAEVVGDKYNYLDSAKEVITNYLTTYKEGFIVDKFVDAEEAYRILMKDVEAYLNDET